MELKLANGQTVDIKKAELIGNNWGHDRFYIDSNGLEYHSCTCSQDLYKVMELNTFINNMIDKMPSKDNVRFDFKLTIEI